MKYRKKPVVIEAIQWNGKNLIDVRTFIDGKKPNIEGYHNSYQWDKYYDMVSVDGLIIPTLDPRF